MIDLPHFEDGVGTPKVGPMTMRFEYCGAFYAMHLPAKFYRPMFNRSEVIVLTNKQTHLQADFVESVHHLAQLCCAIKY